MLCPPGDAAIPPGVRDQVGRGQGELSSRPLLLHEKLPRRPPPTREMRSHTCGSIWGGRTKDQSTILRMRLHGMRTFNQVKRGRSFRPLYLSSRAETCVGRMGCGHEGQRPSADTLRNSGPPCPFATASKEVFLLPVSATVCAHRVGLHRNMRFQEAFPEGISLAIQ